MIFEHLEKSNLTVDPLTVVFDIITKASNRHDASRAAAHDISKAFDAGLLHNLRSYVKSDFQSYFVYSWY